jgi:RNA polymerase sigma-70 factor, ECF subfamily
MDLAGVAMGCDDADLIQRWQHGDAAAFEALVRRWQQPVGRFLFRLVGRAEEANDLCQEVFLRVFLAGPRYRPRAAFSTWLYRIALNVSRDAARRRRRQPLALSDCDVKDHASSAEAICQQQELATIVAAAVAELPEPLRTVLVLHHYEGMNFEAIAQLTATPASTLKSRFAAALRRLRERLQHLREAAEEEAL